MDENVEQIGFVNQWNSTLLRKTKCSVCNKPLRSPCPSCAVNTRIDEPCWAYLDRHYNYRHQHCYAPTMGKKYGKANK